MRVPLQNLILPPNLVAGMNPLKLMAITYNLRTTLDDVTPIEVFALGHLAGYGNVWAVHDGKHRVVASYIAGRQDIPIVILSDLGKRQSA